MKKKTNLRDKLLKRFYGVPGVLDEYKRQEINRIGNNAFIGLWLYLLLSSFFAILLAARHPEEAFWIYLTGNLIVGIFVISGYVLFAAHKSKLTDDEVEEKNLKQTKKKLLLKGCGLAVYFAVAIHLLNTLLEGVFGGNALNFLLSPEKMLHSLTGGLIYGALMTLVMFFRIKKVKE